MQLTLLGDTCVPILDPRSVAAVISVFSTPLSLLMQMVIKGFKSLSSIVFSLGYAYNIRLLHYGKSESKLDVSIKPLHPEFKESCRRTGRKIVPVRGDEGHQKNKAL